MGTNELPHYLQNVTMKRKYNKLNKDVFCSLYNITADGRIFNKMTGHEYVSSFDKKGYKILRLPYPDSTNKDGRRPFKVHRLVALIYLPDYSEDLQVNHKNGIKHDNRVENLEMVTNRQNAIHAWRQLDSTNRRETMRKISGLRDLPKMIESAKISNKKRIACLSKNKEVICVYPSLTAAAMAMKAKSLAAIGKAAREGRKSCGYYWKYL